MIARGEGLIQVSFAGQQPLRDGVSRTRISTTDQTEPSKLLGSELVGDLSEISALGEALETFR